MSILYRKRGVQFCSLGQDSLQLNQFQNFLVASTFFLLFAVTLYDTLCSSILVHRHLMQSARSSDATWKRLEFWMAWLKVCWSESNHCSICMQTLVPLPWIMSRMPNGLAVLLCMEPDRSTFTRSISCSLITFASVCVVLAIHLNWPWCTAACGTYPDYLYPSYPCLHAFSARTFWTLHPLFSFFHNFVNVPSCLVCPTGKLDNHWFVCQQIFLTDY